MLIPGEEPTSEAREGEKMAYNKTPAAATAAVGKKKYEPGPNDMGSLWLNQTKKGGQMLSGTLEFNSDIIAEINKTGKLEVVAFPKEVMTVKGEKTVFNVLKSKPQEVQEE